MATKTAKVKVVKVVRPKLKLDNDAKAEILKQGKESQFWKIMLGAIFESIDDIDRKINDPELKNLPAEQYKFMVEGFKDKKEFLLTLTKTPDNILSWLGTPDNERQNFDPY